MELKALPHDLTVCKVQTLADVDLNSELLFIGKTDEELSVVCPTAATPERTLAREDGWKALRVQGELDFSLVGILARIAGTLADAGISIFTVSTYNTDYVLVKADAFDRAIDALSAAGYSIVS